MERERPTIKGNILSVGFARLDISQCICEYARCARPARVVHPDGTLRCGFHLAAPDLGWPADDVD